MSNLKKLPKYDNKHIKNNLVGVFHSIADETWHSLEEWWRDQEKILESIEKYKELVANCNYPQEKRLAEEELKTAIKYFASINDLFETILEFRGHWLLAMLGVYSETKKKIEAISENIPLVLEVMESIQFSVLEAIKDSTLQYKVIRVLVAQSTLEEVDAALQNAKAITQANYKFERASLDLPEILDDQETELAEIYKAVISSLWDGRERRKYAYWLRAIKKIIKVVNIGDIAKDRAEKLQEVLQDGRPRSSILDIITFGQELYEEIVTDPDIVNAWIEEIEEDE